MTAAQRRPVSIDDLFELRLVSHARISPDGEQIAYVVTRLDQEADDYRSDIWLVGAADGEPHQVSRGTQRDLQPAWSPDGQYLAFLSARPNGGKGESKKETGKPPQQIWILPVAGGEPWPATSFESGVSEFAWSPDSRHLVASAKGPASPDVNETRMVLTRLRYKADGEGLWDGKWKHLYVVGLDGGEPRQITDGDWHDSSPTWSPDGESIAFISSRLEDRDYSIVSDVWLVPASGGKAQQLTESTGPLKLVVWSPDGSSLAIVGSMSPDLGFAADDDLWTLDLASRQIANLTSQIDRPVASGVMSDISGPSAEPAPVWSSDAEWIYFTVGDQGSANLLRVRPSTKLIEPVLVGQHNIQSFSLDRAGRQLAVTLANAVTPAEVYSLTPPADAPQQRTGHNRAWLEAVAISAPERFSVMSRDGCAVEGWYLLPPNAEPGRRYPTLLEIHGGPHSQYGYSFFHEFQVLAGAGYVVVYSNPHASNGYGQHFTAATRGAWGDLDYDDVMRVVDHAVTLPAVDPNRLGVLGGSYGGYMTNWIIGHNKRFKAAVTMRSVTNFMSMYGASDMGPIFGDWVQGMPWWEAPEEYLARSPISYVKDMTTPLLIIHNERDDRCPIEQAEQLFNALRRLGRTVEFVRFPEENHNLSRSGKPSRRVERLNQILRWFNRFLGAENVASATSADVQVVR